jgi:hypothetical protein
MNMCVVTMIMLLMEAYYIDYTYVIMVCYVYVLLYKAAVITSI